jgi:lysozyme family protein
MGVLDIFKTGREKLISAVIMGITEAEKAIPGASGEEKREWVAKRVDDAVVLPTMLDTVLNVDYLGAIALINIVCDKMNLLTDKKMGDLTEPQIAKVRSIIVADVPQDVVSTAVSTTPKDDPQYVDKRLDQLMKLYGIPNDAPVEDTPHKDLPKPVPTEQVVPAVKPEYDEANWLRVSKLVLSAEGGYVNHPADKGGETNMGITHSTLAAAIAQGIVPAVTVKNLTKEQALAIYRNNYWRNAGWGRVCWYVCYLGYDATVNHGTGGAARIMQRALNEYAPKLTPLDTDGVLGPKTRARLVSLFGVETPPKDISQFGDLYLKYRKKFYDDIIAKNPSQAVFKKGWYNRLKKIASEVGLNFEV